MSLPHPPASLASAGPPSKLFLALGSAAALSVGCATEPTRPPETHSAQSPAVQQPISTLNLSADQAGQLQAALQFVGTQSKLALKERAAADRVETAFTRLAEAIESDDSAEAHRALEAARAAVTRYRALAVAANDME